MSFLARRFRPRKEDLVVALATGIFSAAFCFLPPTIFESGDYLLYWKPTFHFLSESVRAGALPLWNPYIGLGRPFLADMQNAVFYPPMYLVCLGEHLGVFLLVWLHCLLAVVGMRRLGSVLGTGRWQSYFMGFSYLASGALVARWVTGQITYCWGLCYVPWLLYHAVRTEERWEGWRLAQYAGCLALQFLCGHPQVFWFSTIGQAVFILASTVGRPVRQAVGEVWHRYWQFGVACAWCAGLVAVVLLPMIELVHQSNRTDSTAVFANSYNMTWSDLRYLFVPRWWGIIWETNLLVGTVVVTAGALGLCRLRDRRMRGLLAMLVIGLLIALGNQTPFFSLFYKWLPAYAGFRFQTRAALLVVVALICGAGVWFSHPHPRLRAAWEYLFGIPARAALVLVVGLQVFDLLQGAWMAKRFITPTCRLLLEVPCEHSVEQALVAALQHENLIKPGQAPPRVCVPPTVVPANYGMIYHYANFDANCSLFLRRPWDYLHAMLGIAPPIEKASLARQVYDHSPFPYRDLALSVGKAPQQPRILVAGDPSPRAAVVYAAQNADYREVLERLARGHEIYQCALLETPLSQWLPQTNSLGPRRATVRHFEPNELVVDLTARTNALLVVAEAWYPGWKAEVDGQPAACLPVNAWMRAVPVRAGRHLARLYFRQDYLAPGLLVSLASVGLLIVASLRRKRPAPGSLAEPEAVGEAVLPIQAEANRPDRESEAASRGGAWFRGLVRALAIGAALAFFALLVYTESRQVVWFRGKTSGAEALIQYYIGDALLQQDRPAEAERCLLEAVRLADQANRLAGYTDPLQLWTLAKAQAALGSLDKAIEAATLGRRLLALTGQTDLDGTFQAVIDACEARKKAQASPAK